MVTHFVSKGRRRVPAVLAACLLALAAGMVSAPRPVAAADERPVLVFAAASLKNALDEVAATFSQETGAKVTAAYAASSALAKQIEQGAPAAMFLSADLDWMDHLEQRGLIARDTRRNLLGNRLVLVAGRDSRIPDVALEPGVDVAGLLDGGRLAVADVRAVPAGKYAKAALEHLGAWGPVAGRLAQAENVRAALNLVSRGEAPLGIVYATDVAADPNARIVGTFPESSHPPIIYPVALTSAAAAGTPDAAAFLTYLRGPAARAAFATHGFTILDAPAS